MKMNNLLAIAGLTLLSIGSAEATQAFVDLALYRPSTGQFFVRSSLTGSVGAIQFGAPGDQGLLCKFNSNAISGGDNLVVFRNGIWFVNFPADGATAFGPVSYGAPTDQPLCGSYGFGSGSGLGLFRNGLWFINNSVTPSFSFGTGGDIAVHIGAKGYGNMTDRVNMIYGVYRAGVWYIDEFGTGAPTHTYNFGGQIQDVPLLIPSWVGSGPYSLAIYRDGTWFIQPLPGGPTTVTVQFGATGDIPLVRGAH